MKYSLIPEGFRKLMLVNKKVTLVADLVLLLPLLVFWWMGFYDMAKAILYLSVPLMLMLTILLVKFFYYDNTVQSMVELCQDRILILSKKNCCWREIPYNVITNVAVKEIHGFFYGSRKDEFKSKYICLFLNDKKDIPIVSYPKLFRQQDFCMIAFTEELWNMFNNIYRKQ